jgi:hypothetical protein
MTTYRIFNVDKPSQEIIVDLDELTLYCSGVDIFSIIYINNKIIMSVKGNPNIDMSTKTLTVD